MYIWQQDETGMQKSFCAQIVRANLANAFLIGVSLAVFVYVSLQFVYLFFHLLQILTSLHVMFI